jgi:hypothetical protein
MEKGERIMKLKVYTYPEGRYDSLDPYDEILRIDSNGKFVVQQVGEGLVDGDQYALSPQQELPKRKAEDVFAFIAARKLRFTWVDALAPDSEGTLGEDTLIISDDKFVDLHRAGIKAGGGAFERVNLLRESVEFIMDQEEL